MSVSLKSDTVVTAHPRLSHRMPARVLLVVLTLCAACVAVEERDRVRSPDGLLEAVIQTRNGGPTTSLVYTVHLVASGSPLNRGSEVFAVDRVAGISVSWSEARVLAVAYDSEARIFHFANRWDSPHGEVSIRMVPRSVAATRADTDEHHE